METAAASRTISYDCAHCGLPVARITRGNDEDGEIFCCHACRLAAVIVGRQERGDQAWTLLRLGLGALLAMNVMMISLLLYTGSIEPGSIPIFRKILLGLSAPAIAILVPPFVAGAGREMRAGRMSLDTLIAGGALAAFLVSAVNAVRGAGEIYFDTATMIPVLVTVGKLIEASAKTRAAELLRGLESLLPPTAHRVTEGGVEEVPIDALRAADLIQIRPGERIPVDGTITAGSSSIEDAAFSGEFLPRLCSPGDSVIAGTINGTGALVVRADRTGSDLLLHGIISMIQDAWRTPSRSERIAEKAAALFIPAVLVIAAGAAIGWTLLGNGEKGLLCAISVLVVACPCTMGIATPLATSLAIARAGKAGIVVRGGSVMERMSEIKLAFFDKTGTVTTGRPMVEEVVIVDPFTDEDELLGRAAAIESASEHPVAQAIAGEASRRGIAPGHASNITVFPGLGVKGEVTWRGTAKEVAAGTGSLVTGDGGYGRSRDTRTAIEVGWDGKIRGRLLLSDGVRRDAAECMAALAAQGIACMLLSGDSFSAASAVARQVGIEEVYAPRTPAQKLEAVSATVASGSHVAMVGDGINDAPALAAAQTGIALGAGTELAKQAGDVVILSESLMQIPWLINLSRRAGKIIRANFAVSFAYNAPALAAAAAGLLHPLLAALLMVVSSLTVLGNSLRIASFPGLDGDVR